VGLWCADRGGGEIIPPKKTTFGDFTVLIRRPPGAAFDLNIVIVALQHRNMTILEMNSVNCTFAIAGKPVQGTPRAGCRMMKVTCDTGGSQCCATQIFLTSCGNRGGVTIIDIGHGNPDLPIKDVNGNGDQEIVVNDRQLVCYSLWKS
jgi:hypothetical protein